MLVGQVQVQGKVQVHLQEHVQLQVQVQLQGVKYLKTVDGEGAGRPGTGKRGCSQMLRSAGT